MDGHSSHQMKGAKFLTLSILTLNRAFVRGSGGHLVLNRYLVYVFN